MTDDFSNKILEFIKKDKDDTDTDSDTKSENESKSDESENESESDSESEKGSKSDGESEKGTKLEEDEDVRRMYEVAEKLKADPFQSSYLKKENRINLYDFDKDPVKANLQALLRKAALQVNKEMENVLPGLNRSSTKREVYSKEDVNILTNMGYTVDVAVEILNKLTNVDRKKFHQEKLIKACDRKIQDTNPILKELLKDFKQNKEEDKEFKKEFKEFTEEFKQSKEEQKRFNKKLIQRLISNENKLTSGKKQSPAELSFCEKLKLMMDTEFEIYFQVFQDLMDVTINALKNGEAKDSSLKKRLKNFSQSYFIALVTTLKQLLIFSVKTARNIVTFAADVFLRWKPVEGFTNAFFRFLVDVISCIGAVTFLYVNILIISFIASILTFVTNYFGLMSISEYVKTWQDEITNFLGDLASDLFMLPLRSFWYIFINRNVFEEEEQNEYLTYLVKPILNLFINVFQPIQKVLMQKQPIKGIMESVQSIGDVLAWVWSEVKNQYASYLEFQERMRKYAEEKAAEVLNYGLKAIGNGRKVLAKAGKKAYGMLNNWFKSNPNPRAINYQPNALYDAMAVCSLLQISMMALKQHKNKEVVSYALNNNMSKLETFFVVCELAKDMEAKENLQLENKVIKF